MLALAIFTPLYEKIFDFGEKMFANIWNKGDATENALTKATQSKSTLIKQIDELEKQLASQDIDMLRVEYLAQQFETMDQMISTDLFPAAVIQKGSFANPDALIINQGSRVGITTGDAVFAADGLLIGYAGEVYDNTTRVILYSKPSEEVSGVMGEGLVSVTAGGYGKGGLFIEAPRDLVVNEGDVLYSQYFPGKVIAIVRKVDFDARDPFQKVYLSYPVNINQIQAVGIQLQKTSE